MPAVLQSTLAFLVVLGVLVFVHELGHYLAARLVLVHVEVFSIGFGPAIATWRDRVGTVWKLAWLPLGGYVKLHGHERPEVMVPEEPSEPGGVGRAIMRWRGRASRATLRCSSTPSWSRTPPPSICGRHWDSAS